MEARDLRRVGLDEYLELDHASEERWEYVDGEAFAMASATPEHNIVKRNIVNALSAALARKPCLVFPDGQKVATPRTRGYHYPDALVVCGTPSYDQRDDRAIVNPTLIVEVLSPSTEDYDRGGKLVHYRSNASFTNYLLVSIDDRMLEHHVRIEPGRWMMTEIREGQLEIESIGVTLSIANFWVDLDRLGR